MKVALAKWSLYKQWRAPSGHDTKKGRTKSTRDYETRQTRKEPETNEEQKWIEKKEENKQSHSRQRCKETAFCELAIRDSNRQSSVTLVRNGVKQKAQWTITFLRPVTTYDRVVTNYHYLAARACCRRIAINYITKSSRRIDRNPTLMTSVVRFLQYKHRFYVRITADVSYANTSGKVYFSLEHTQLSSAFLKRFHRTLSYTFLYRQIHFLNILHLFAGYLVTLSMAYIMLSIALNGWCLMKWK